MIQLFIPKSRSAKFAGAIKQARILGELSEQENGFMLKLNSKNIFQFWDEFNLLFWTVVDWKGMYVKFHDNKIHSHSDKTLIFYRIQLAHMKWNKIITDQIKWMCDDVLGFKTMDHVTREIEIDAALDELFNTIYPT